MFFSPSITTITNLVPVFWTVSEGEKRHLIAEVKYLVPYYGEKPVLQAKKYSIFYAIKI